MKTTDDKRIHSALSQPHPADERVVEADIERIAKWMYEASDEDGYSIPWADKRNSRLRAQSRKQVRDVLSARDSLAKEGR